MNCEQLIRYLSDYINQDLDEDLAAEAREHLATCKNCKIVLDTTRQTIRLYRQTGRQTLPAGRRGELFRRLKTALDAGDKDSQ
jgi:hypothetical protein